MRGSFLFGRSRGRRPAGDASEPELVAAPGPDPAGLDRANARPADLARSGPPAWSSLAPIVPTISAPATASNSAEFARGLGARRPAPVVLRALRHDVSPLAAAGAFRPRPAVAPSDGSAGLASPDGANRPGRASPHGLAGAGVRRARAAAERSALGAPAPADPGIGRSGSASVAVAVAEGAGASIRRAATSSVASPVDPAGAFTAVARPRSLVAVADPATATLARTGSPLPPTPARALGPPGARPSASPTVSAAAPGAPLTAGPAPDMKVVPRFSAGSAVQAVLPGPVDRAVTRDGVSQPPVDRDPGASTRPARRGRILEGPAARTPADGSASGGTPSDRSAPDRSTVRRLGLGRPVARAADPSPAAPLPSDPSPAAPSLFAPPSETVPPFDPPRDEGADEPAPVGRQPASEVEDVATRVNRSALGDPGPTVGRRTTPSDAWSGGPPRTGQLVSGPIGPEGAAAPRPEDPVAPEVGDSTPVDPAAGSTLNRLSDASAAGPAFVPARKADERPIALPPAQQSDPAPGQWTATSPELAPARTTSVSRSTPSTAARPTPPGPALAAPLVSRVARRPADALGDEAAPWTDRASPAGRPLGLGRPLTGEPEQARTGLTTNDGHQPTFSHTAFPAFRGAGSGSRVAVARAAGQPAALASIAGSRWQAPATPAKPAAQPEPAPFLSTAPVVTVVAREAAGPQPAEPAPVAAPPVGTGAAPGSPVHLTSGPAAAPATSADLPPAELSKLAERVYEYLARRLRGELLDDRERRGLLGDPL